MSKIIIFLLVINIYSQYKLGGTGIMYRDMVAEIAGNTENMIIVDVGGGTGWFLTQFKKNNRLIAIEPNKDNCNIIKSVYNNIEIVPYATFTNLKKVKLYLNKNSSSIYKQDNKEYKLVEAKSIEEICSEYNIQHIDVMQINCEGAEYNILDMDGQEWLEKIDHLLIHMHTKTKKFLSKKYYKKRKKIMSTLKANGFVFVCGCKNLNYKSHIIQLWKK